MALRFFVRQRIRRLVSSNKPPQLKPLDEASGLVILTQLSGNEAVVLLNRLQARFPSAESIAVINLSREKKLTSLRDGHRTLVEVSPKNLNFFGGFNPNLAGMLKDLWGDVLVNTDNSNSDLLHTIAASLKVNLKCGIYNPYDLPLYNPLIYPDKEQNPEEYIETVNAYLKSLTGKK